MRLATIGNYREKGAGLRSRGYWRREEGEQIMEWYIFFGTIIGLCCAGYIIGFIDKKRRDREINRIRLMERLDSVKFSTSQQHALLDCFKHCKNEGW